MTSIYPNLQLLTENVFDDDVSGTLNDGGISLNTNMGWVLLLTWPVLVNTSRISLTVLCRY